MPSPVAEMIWEIKENYGLNSPRVFKAMLQIPREKFVEGKYKDLAYKDTPISIGFGQTMSQPYTVAFMTHLLASSIKNQVSSKVLEIGTGSGYQAAVLSQLFSKVYTVEIIPELADMAKKTLKDLGYKNVIVKQGSGEGGWPEQAPFEAIIVTAATEIKFVRDFFNQLKVGGVLVAPLGKADGSEMTRITKLKGFKSSDLKNPTSLKLRGVWEEFGTFYFVPFVEEKS